MRIPEYYSPSSLGLWLKNKEEYYVKYLSDKRPGRTNQSMAMAVGSAFDALVKTYLHNKIIGPNAPDWMTLQVEVQNRLTAERYGGMLFEHYRTSGALGDLLLLLDQVEGEPRLETEVRGTVSRMTGNGLESVTLLGKPDLFFKIRTADCGTIGVIIDWKVNGIFKNTGCLNDKTCSPDAGYRRIYPGGLCHRDYAEVKYCGVGVSAVPLNNLDWVRQLSIYSWLIGAAVGDPVIVGIDQITGPVLGNDLRKTRCANHRNLITEIQQHQLFDELVTLDKIIRSGWIFRDLSRDESLERQATLDDVEPASEYQIDKHDAWWRSTMMNRF